MKEILSKEIITSELSEGAILNKEYNGFEQDYLVLHCLIKKYKPKTFLEVGTNMGTGTNIICHANPGAKVYTLDLPYELAHVSLQSPVSEGKGMKTGSNCVYPFTQLWGDSTKFDYSKYYPIEGWYIDGEHIYDNVLIESKEAIKSKAKIIIWHDTDMGEVYKGIMDAFKENKNYKLFRVKDTRISYALWQDSE